MLGTEALASLQDAQVVICENAGIAEVVAKVLTDQVIITFEPDNDDSIESFAFVENRDVIVLGELPMIFITRNNPSRLRICTDTVPYDFSVQWLKGHIDTYSAKTEKPELRVVKPYNEPSSGQSPETVRSGGSSSGAPRANPDLSTSDPDDDPDGGSDTGDYSLAEDLEIPEPPEHLEDGPDSHLPRLNGHGNGDKSAGSPYSAEYWDLPIDIFGQSKPPTEFDTSVFTGELSFIDTFCSDLSELKGTDYGIAAVSAIVSLSAWVHESWLLQVKSRDTTWREAARLWAFICGDSSDGKSVGLALATKPARDLDSIAGKEAAVALAKYASDLRVHEKQVAAYEKRASENTLNPGETMPQPPDRIEIDKRLFTSATPEGLRLLLETTPKGWLYADELSAWAANMGKYSAQKDASIGERSQWLQAWDGGSQSILRGAKPIHIDSWSSCILGGVTDGSIRASLGGGKLTGDGLIQRFMLVHTRHQRPDIDHEQDAQALAAMKKTLNALRHMRPDADKPLRLSPEAYQYFRGFMERLEQSANSGIYPATCQSHILKYRSNAVRIALTLHLAMRGATGTECAAGEYVELPILKMACDICEQLIPHTIYFWESVIGDGRAEIDADMYRVCELICCWHLDGDKITQSDIGSSFKDWRKPSYEVRKKVSILAALQGMNWIRPYAGSRQLSPGIADSYKLHPALRRMYDKHPTILNARVYRLAVGAKFRAMREQNQGPESMPLH